MRSTRVSRSRFATATGVAVAAAVAVAGPRARVEERWIEPELPSDLDAYLAAAEADVPDLRPGDGREIVWADPVARARTPLALLYFHGFSADRHELEPVISRVGAQVGANVYFTRLTGHGRDGPAMAEASASDWLDDAAEAVAIGRVIGERIVLIGTSQGGSLATWTAARLGDDPALAGFVLISPNYRPKDGRSRLLLLPWGGLLSRVFVGEERCFEPHNAAEERHWTECYPTRALLPMMALSERVRTMDLGTVVAPGLVLRSSGDLVVDVDEIDRVVGRMAGDVRLLRFEGSEDPGGHVLAGDALSPGSNDEVTDLVVDFLASLGPRGAGGGS